MLGIYLMAHSYSSRTQNKGEREDFRKCELMIGELIEGWLVMYLLYSRHGLLYRALIIGILLMTWMF
jgi:hypothetical protein